MWLWKHSRSLVVLVTAAAVGQGAIHVVDAGALGGRHHPPVPPTLVEAASCRAGHQRGGGTDTATNEPNAQQIAVTIPAITMLRMNARGTIAAAATSTGCRPRAGDDVYVEQADGSFMVTTAIDVGAVRWTGDFTTPGRYQAQQPG